MSLMLQNSRRVVRWGLVPAGLAFLTLTGCGGGLFKRNQVPDYSSLNSAPLENFEKLDDKQVANLRFAAARSQEANGSLEEALATYKEVIKLDPSRADANHRIAIVYDKMARFESSGEYYQKALKLQPGNPDIFCDVGYSQYLQQRYPDAEMNLRQAIQLKPDHPRAHNNLAMILAHSGRIDESLKSFQRGGAKPQDAHTNVAFALASHGKFDDARQHYKMALAHDPEFEKAQEGLSEISRLQEKAERIRAVAQEFGTLDQEPLAGYARPNANKGTSVIGPNAAVAAAGIPNQSPMYARQTPAPFKPVARTESKPEQKQAALEPAPWARQAAKPVSKPAVIEEAAAEIQPVAAVATPKVAKAPAAEKPAAKPGKAPKLSFSKGALHRDRYLEEQTDPALQQAGFTDSE